MLIAVLGAAVAAFLGWITGSPDALAMGATAFLWGVIGASAIEDLRGCRRDSVVVGGCAGEPEHTPQD